MNRRFFHLFLPALMLMFGATPAEDDSVTAIRSVLDRQVLDWNKKDLDSFSMSYWKSPKLVFQSGGDRTEGWEGMRDRYRKSYQADGKSMGTLKFQNVEVTILAPDVAMVTGGWHLTMPDGETPHGLYTLILRKFPEGWKIVHDHTSKA